MSPTQSFRYAGLLATLVTAVTVQAQDYRDRYEPNNNSGDATALEAPDGRVDEEVLTVYPTGDVDYFQFSLSARGQSAHYVEVQAAVYEPIFSLPGRVDVTLFDSQGSQLEKKSTPVSYSREEVRFGLENRPAGLYLLRVEGRAGLVIGAFNLVGSLPAATAPTITTPPQSQTATAGATVTFTVVATGTSPLSYQWRKDGSNVPGGTSATLTIANVQPAQAGNYWVIVSNQAGSTTSALASLTVNPSGPPVGEAVRTLPTGYAPGTKFVVSLRVTPGAGVTAFGVEDQPPGGWAVSDVSDGGEFDAQNRKVKWDPFFTSSTPSKTLTYQVTPPPGATGEATFDGVASFDGVNLPVKGDRAIAPGATGTPPRITTQPVGQTVTRGGTVSLVVQAEGSAPLTYQWRLGEQDLLGETQPTLALPNFQDSDAGTYTVVVRNALGAVISQPAVLTVGAPGGPPLIVTQPASQTVNIGATVTFNVNATGEGTLSYQWRFNRVPIPGATTATYVLPSVKDSDAGSYSVVVSNTHGAVVSQAAMLTLGSTRPQFTSFQYVPQQGFRIRLNGPAGSRYALEVSTDLRNWVEIVTLNNPSGTIDLTDAEALAFGQGFYRARQVAP